MPICVSCGHDSAEGTRYCEECGVALGRATTPDAHPDEVAEDASEPGARSATQRAQEPPPPPPGEERPGEPV